MKITLEHYGDTYTAEISDESNVAKVLQIFCNILVSQGYSKSSIIDMFNDADDRKAQTNNPFNWEVS